MQGNQQANQRYMGDFGMQNQNGNQPIQNCSTFAVAFNNVKYLANQLTIQDPNNELWHKMLFEVSFQWIRQNKEQFKRELERYQEQLMNAVNARVHPSDLRWMKTYVKIMLDILNSELN